ncbi:hypothetical protein AB0M02_18875 [Actinoplanes sp. NPDC051861]|uniref:hypothetical protein n=1 Tax=Actinoplanes sp. NPDC051861 TaxID=3155170 RepID=UPI00342F8095
MAYLRRTGAVLATIALIGVAAVPASAARGGEIASLRGSARVLFPPSPDDDVRFAVDAHARYRNPTGSPFPAAGDSWGTARLTHVFTGERPGVIWYSIRVTCLMTGGNTATVTGEIVDAAPDGRSAIGSVVGFSVTDLGRRDRVGFTGLPTGDQPVLRECMGPAGYFSLRDGDYTVVDAAHW